MNSMGIALLVIAILVGSILAGVDLQRRVFRSLWRRRTLHRSSPPATPAADGAATPPHPPPDQPVPRPRDPLSWLAFWFVTAVIYAAIAYTAWYFRAEWFTLFDEEWNKGLTIILGLALYTIASLRIVGPTDLGLIIFLGKPILRVWSGLSFVPFGTCYLLTETRNIIQNELPAEPQHIYRLKDGESAIPPELVKQGFREPTRITFADAPEEPGPQDPRRSDDLLQRRVTAEVPIVVRWRIVDYLKFVATIGSKIEAVRQMEDAAVAMATQVLPQHTAAEVLARIEEFNKQIKQAIEDRIQEKSEHYGWGIDLESAQIKLIDLGHRLSITLQKVPEARAEANATILRAEAEKIRLTREGEGRGAAEQAVLAGRTAGFKNMAAELQVGSEAILGAETARVIATGPNQVIVVGTGGLTDLVGAAATIGKSLGATKGSQPPAPAPQSAGDQP